MIEDLNIQNPKPKFGDMKYENHSTFSPTHGAIIKDFHKRSVTKHPSCFSCTFRQHRARRQYRFGTFSECCFVLWLEFFLAFLQKFYIYTSYCGYTSGMWG